MTEPITITVLTPTTKSDSAVTRWEKNRMWVFEDPYRVAVGRSYPESKNDICPVWGDRMPWKSVTVIVPADEEDDAAFCLACAHGSGYSNRKVLEDGRIALRSDYTAW